METPCVTPLRGYSPRIQTLRSEKEPLLWTQVSSYQRQCRSDVFSRVYYTATKQCLQRLAGLEAMRKNSAPLRLSETLWNQSAVSATQSAVISLPRAHSSDVFLFLRWEERGRGVIVIQDGRGAFLEQSSSGRIRRVTSALQCLYSETHKSRVPQYIPLVGRTQAHSASMDRRTCMDGLCDNRPLGTGM